MMFRGATNRLPFRGLAILALLIPPGQAAGQIDPGPPPIEIDCPVCHLWESYADAIQGARLEVGALSNGTIYYIHSSDFRTVEQLQRFAYERKSLEEEAAARGPGGHPKIRLGGGHEGESGEVTLEIAPSAHGFFAILSSADPATVKRLQREASYAVRSNVPVRF